MPRNNVTGKVRCVIYCLQLILLCKEHAKEHPMSSQASKYNAQHAKEHPTEQVQEKYTVLTGVGIWVRGLIILPPFQIINRLIFFNT